MSFEGNIRLCSNIENQERRRTLMRLEKGLTGEGIEGLPADRDIKGIMVVLFTELPGDGLYGRQLIYIQEETMKKEVWDKWPGDYSIVAEGRKAGESLPETVIRGIREEAGLGINRVYVYGEPIGWFQFKPLGEGDGDNWIVAFRAWVHPDIVENVRTGPLDGETINAGWRDPREVLNSPFLRGGVEGILRLHLEEQKNVVMWASAGRHRYDEVFGVKDKVLQGVGQ